MTYSEDDLLPLSALQHLRFCERQCALIHVEGLWAENRLTVEGGHLHRKAHEGPSESRGDLRVERGVPLRSFRLGLVGQADVVELHRSAAGEWIPFPVEYKRGRPKRDGSDEMQLVAQALCLEEMLGVKVPAGALYYGTTRRRKDVAFTVELRDEVEREAVKLHALIAAGVTPRAVREPKCERCSLLHLCLPTAADPARSAADPARSAARYLERSLRAATSAFPVPDEP